MILVNLPMVGNSVLWEDPFVDLSVQKYDADDNIFKKVARIILDRVL